MFLISSICFSVFPFTACKAKALAKVDLAFIKLFTPSASSRPNLLFRNAFKEYSPLCAGLAPHLTHAFINASAIKGEPWIENSAVSSPVYDFGPL